MNPINKVTLKGGLQAGDFTDIGRVGSIQDCYDTCCQQEKCDLAFMLGQNCFTVVCKDKKMCVTTPAQPSIFNPQIAYLTKRELSNQKSKGRRFVSVAALQNSVLFIQWKISLKRAWSKTDSGKLFPY